MYTQKELSNTYIYCVQIHLHQYTSLTSRGPEPVSREGDGQSVYNIKALNLTPLAEVPPEGVFHRLGSGVLVLQQVTYGTSHSRLLRMHVQE